MIKIAPSSYDFEASIAYCIAGIASTMPLNSKISAASAELIMQGAAYTLAGIAGTLFAIPSFMGGPHSIVFADISKSDLLKLYEQYFVPEQKVARRIYDQIMALALEKCPFCGGIGTPRNLDHYLPKSRFPQFSVLPHNLVPSCRDCNMDGKGEFAATSLQEQVIHPHLDTANFFDQQWMFARHVTSYLDNDGYIEYFVAAPDVWTSVDKMRVKSHFQRFALGRRYSLRAAEHLPTALRQIRAMKSKGVSASDITEVLCKPGISEAPFINHWQRGFYQALEVSLGN